MRGRKRTRKILIGICVFLLAAALAFQLYIGRLLSKVIHKRLETLIVSGSDSLYNFQLDTINVSFWSNSVTVTNLHIKVDSLHYARQEQAGNLPALTVEIDLAKGSVSGIQLLQLLVNKKINVGTILSKNAGITLSRHFRKSRQTLDKGLNKPLWKLLQPDIHSIKIDRILLDDVNLNYSNADSATAFHWKFEHCSAIVDDTRVDSVAAADTSRILSTKNISIVFNNIKLQTPDALYAIESKQLNYSSEKRTLKAEDFKLHTVLNRQATYKKLGYDKDLFTLDFAEFTLTDFQLPLWINRNILSIGTIELSKPVVHVYKDRTITPDKRTKYGKYPHQLLAKAPFTISIRKIKVDDGLVTYTEKNKKSEKEGKLVFQRLEGTIRNITNDKAEIKINPKCIADIRGVYMNQSPLHTVFTFYMDKTDDGIFDVSATLEKINAEQLNPVTVPLAQASVKSFDIARLNYFIKGSEKTGTGSLSMIYNNLDVELQKLDENNKAKDRKFLSFIVSKLVIYPKNPMKDKERKATGIRVKRIPNKSFFNLVWKTLFAAAKDITIRVDALKKIDPKKEK